MNSWDSWGVVDLSSLNLQCQYKCVRKKEYILPTLGPGQSAGVEMTRKIKEFMTLA